MSNVYDKLAKKAQQKKSQPTQPKYNIHKISFDDSDISERSDAPNVFIDQREAYNIDEEIKNIQKKPKKSTKKQANMKNEQSLEEFERKNKSKSVIRQEEKAMRDDIQLVDDQQIPQGEDEIQPNTQLSLVEILKLHLGEFAFTNFFPSKKIVYIDNNNDQQNEINRREHANKLKDQFKTATRSYFSNQIWNGWLLMFLTVLFRSIFTNFTLYIWVAITILVYIMESIILAGYLQYEADKNILWVLLGIAVFFSFLMEYVSIRKRNNFHQNTNSYRIYHHNGTLAQWIYQKAIHLKAGQVYKVPPGEIVPTDVLLLHATRSIVQIEEDHLRCNLMQKSSEIVLKQTLIKNQIIILPISGAFIYDIQGFDSNQYQVNGKLNLEEPKQEILNAGVKNIIHRGAINASQVQILCMAMETGIDSLFIKNLQYPFQLRKTDLSRNKLHEQKKHHKYSQNLINHPTFEDPEENNLIKINLMDKVQNITIFCILVYLIMSGVGVLVGYFSTNTKAEFYLGSTTIDAWKFVLYHFTSFLTIIPIFLHISAMMFINMSASVAQDRMSGRQLQFYQEDSKSRSHFDSRSEEEKMHLGDGIQKKRGKSDVKIKDHNIFPQISSIDTIITTIDTFRDVSAFTLQSIKVKELSYSFLTGHLENEAYSIEDVELIKYFMSVSLLTTITDLNQVHQYQQGIEFACRKYLDLKKNKNSMGEILVNGEQFQVKPIFSIKSTVEYPFKLIFLEVCSESKEENNKVLVLIRGKPELILDKIYGKNVKLADESRKLYEEKGLHVELVGKTTLHINDVTEIEKAYNSPALEITTFYKNLDRYLTKIESMGLLIFANQFNQRKIGNSIKNPILNKSLLNQLKIQKGSSYDADIYGSNSLPNMIILAPPSKSAMPEFQSIHTITNLLINPCLFNYTLADVSDKILHDRLSSPSKLVEKLQEEKVLVWNGWDIDLIINEVGALKKQGKKILCYCEKDEYMFLMKECDVSVCGGGSYDCQKYADVVVSSNCTVSYYYMLQLMKYDSSICRQGLISIILNQISKAFFIIVIEFINFFYTRGTGLAIVRSPLHILIEIVMLLDVFYYLNWRDSIRAETYPKTYSFVKKVFFQILQSILIASFITFISIYSLETPSDSTGTSHGYQFTNMAITFAFLHFLILQKLFNNLSLSVSWLKVIIVSIQVLMIYGGFYIISLSSSVELRGILIFVLSGKTIVTMYGVIWISLTIPGLRMLWVLLKTKKIMKKVIGDGNEKLRSD